MSKNKIMQKIPLILIPIVAAGLIFIYETQSLTKKAEKGNSNEEVVNTVDSEELETLDLLSLFVKQENPITIGSDEYIYFSHEKNDCEFLLPAEDKLDFNKVVPLNVDVCLKLFEVIKNTD